MTRSTAPILRQIMDTVQHNCEIRRFVQQRLKVLNCFLFCEVQSELLLNLFVNIAVLDIWDISIYHQGNQIEDKVSTLPKDGESCEAEALKACIVGRLSASHAIHHLFADLHRWRKWFGVPSENVSKVHCKTKLSER